MNVIKRKRESNIELLRIIAMIMIITSHFSLFVRWDLHNQNILQNVKVMMFSPFGTAGATVFFIVTGYFTTRKNVNIQISIKTELKKILNIWCEALFYSLSVVVILMLCGVTIAKNQLLTSIFIFTRAEYWFVSAYIILCLVSPFLSIIVERLNFQEYVRLFIILIVLLISASFNNPLLNNLLLAISGYFVGGFLQKFPKIRWNYNNWYLLGINVIIYFMGLFSIYVMAFLGIQHIHQGHFTSDLFAVFFASGVFLLFLNLKISHSTIINVIASTVFASYLISESTNFRNILWNNFFDIYRIQHSVYFPLYGLLAATVILLAGTVIDLIRQQFLTLFKKILKL